MSASSPPSLPRAFLHSLYPHHPSSTSNPSPSPSPPGPLYTRLSNGSHSVPSPTNSRGSFHGVSFLLQIGLTRETVNLEASDLTLSSVKDLVCSIVDQKVRASSHMIHTQILFLLCPPYTCNSITVCLFSGFSSNTKGSREPPWSTDMCSAISYHIHLFRFRHLGLVPQNDSNTAEACTQQRWCLFSYSTQSSTARYLHCGVQ